MFGVSRDRQQRLGHGMEEDAVDSSSVLKCQDGDLLEALHRLQPLKIQNIQQYVRDVTERYISESGTGNENDIRTLWTFHRDVPIRRELAEHQLGITHVHLAAVGLDVDRRHGARC